MGQSISYMCNLEFNGVASRMIFPPISIKKEKRKKINSFPSERKRS